MADPEGDYDDEEGGEDEYDDAGSDEEGTSGMDPPACVSSPHSVSPPPPHESLCLSRRMHARRSSVRHGALHFRCCMCCDSGA